MKFEPELLKFSDGRKVTKENWEERREDIVDILSRYEYGYSPKKPDGVKASLVERIDKCAGGHGHIERINLSFTADYGEFTFPVNVCVPNNGKKNPVFVFLNFRPEIYDMYFPLEEIIDNGFALAVIYYQDVSSDDGVMNDKLMGKYGRPVDGTGWGKISAWAWAASRVVDYLETRDDIDSENIAVIGHSRLGKTALWCAAQDTRIKLACSNDSGCAGAAYERVKHEGAETCQIIANIFPYWFCGNYWKFAGEIEKAPFDQHMLLAAIAPRHVCVGSASKDDWADQYSEQLSCIGASPAWKLLGKKGFVGPEEPAAVGDDFNEGDIAYHLRDGIHFLSRNDWKAYMEYFKTIL